MNYLNRILTTIVIFSVMVMPCLALEFDVSVDEEIRKNYNPSKLELENLPPVPNVKPTKQTQPITSVPKSPVIPPKGALIPADKKPIVHSADKSTMVKLKKGTKFKVVSEQSVSDASRIGARISFVSQNSVTQRYITVLKGTTFYGEVVDAHLPQMSGNGGLIELKIDSMLYKGSTYGVNAKVTKVNGRKVFVNNIKGQRKYMKNVVKQVDKGENFYKKTRRVSGKLSDNPVGLFVAPVPTLVGMGAYAVNLVGSPIVSIFNKGGRISIPAGSEFEIKLVEDAYLY